MTHAYIRSTAVRTQVHAHIKSDFHIDFYLLYLEFNTESANPIERMSQINIFSTDLEEKVICGPHESDRRVLLCSIDFVP